MKLTLKIRIDAIRVGEQLFNAMLDDGDNIEPMTNALTGDVCDMSAIYKGYLVLRDDRLGADIDDLKVEISGLFSEVEP